MFPSPGDLRHLGASYRKYSSLLEYPHCIMYSPNGARSDERENGEGYETPFCVAVETHVESRRWMREWLCYTRKRKI